ncbi:MAG: putative lactoylglutathione lyase [Halieaceae bacterium]|jgi:predicted lactoylglutathione lyase
MKMNYVVLGTNQMQEAVRFYDALFEGTSMRKVDSGGRMTVWKGEDFMFALAEPIDGEPATRGNGTMVGFSLGSPSEVERLYGTALKLGGADEGELRVRSGRFSGYVRDLDGNKICLYE